MKYWWELNVKCGDTETRLVSTHQTIPEALQVLSVTDEDHFIDLMVEHCEDSPEPLSRTTISFNQLKELK